jgi:signal peptidase II
MENSKKQKLRPFILTGIIILLDQVTKFIIIKNISPFSSGISVFNGFLRIIHTRNKAIAFSIGKGLPESIKTILFIIIPIIVLIVLVIYYFKTKDLNKFQIWAVGGILGGGIGNLIDRIFRSEGVVDFLYFKFYGIFGMERWPAFNIADASIVIFGILLFISILIGEGKKNHEQKS